MIVGSAKGLQQEFLILKLPQMEREKTQNDESPVYNCGALSLARLDPSQDKPASENLYLACQKLKNKKQQTNKKWYAKICHPPKNLRSNCGSNAPFGERYSKRLGRPLELPPKGGGMWPYPRTHVGTLSHPGHLDWVAATLPFQAPELAQWE